MATKGEKSEKDSGTAAFASLLGRLVRVPKDEIEAEERKFKAAQKRKRAAKKK